MTGTYRIIRAKDGNYYFMLIASNGQVLLSSERFQKKDQALSGIESVRKNATRRNAFEIKQSSRGGYYSVLKAANGRIIGQSSLYPTKTGAETAAIRIKEHAEDSRKLDVADAGSSEIGSIRTFLSAMEKIETDRDSVLFYRGHSNSAYNLIPGIFRDSGWIDNEHIMFHELLLRCPNDFNMSNSTFNNLVKMQHYNLPTRLLDITANPLVALYFACSENNSDNGEVLAFRVPKEEIKYHDSDTVSVVSNISRMPYNFSPKKESALKSFNKQLGIVSLVREIQREKPYFEDRVEPNALGKVICVKPLLDNPRIIKQDGAFFLFGMGESKIKPAIVPESYLASTGPLRVIINGNDKLKILEQLSLLGITKSSIYPEIEHVAGHIKNTYKRF